MDIFALDSLILYLTSKTLIYFISLFFPYDFEKKDV